MPGLEDAPREIARQSQPSMNSTSRFSTSGSSFTMNKTHPAVIIAAGAVTIFCAVGVGVLTGIIPSARALNANNVQNAQTTALPPVSNAASTSQAAQSTPAELANANTTITLKPITKPDLGQPLSRGQASAQQVERPTRAPAPAKPTEATQSSYPASANERSATTVATAPVVPSATYPSPATAPVICAQCGTVDSISPITEQGQGSGAGAVIGGVIGGALGRQVGGGRGKDAATVAGAVGGAILGNHIEKNNKATTYMNIRVRMEDGTSQTIRADSDLGYRVGDRVKVDNGRLIRN